MNPQNTIRFCSSNSLTSSIHRHMSSVQAYNSLTNYITDPLNMLCNAGSNELLLSEEMENITAETLKKGKYRSLVKIA